MLNVIKKVLFILPPRDFNDVEFQEIRQLLEDRGHQIVVVSNEPGVCTGMGNLNVSCGPLNEVAVESIDAVVLVGGFGYELLINDPAVILYLQQAFDQNKIIAAIEQAPLVLINAQILGGHEATVLQTHENIERLKKGGVRFSSESLVIDGTIVTAQNELDAIPLASAIADALG